MEDGWLGSKLGWGNVGLESLGGCSWLPFAVDCVVLNENTCRGCLGLAKGEEGG